MAYALPQTTAELLLRAAEAVYVLGPDATTDAVGDFLGTPARAAPALEGARQLALVVEGEVSRTWSGTRIARLLASASPNQKAALLRFQLEEYEPYVLFRNRLVAGEEPTDAARQTCMKFALTVDPLDVKSFLIDCGTFSGGLTYGDAQRLLVNVDEVLLNQVLAVYERLLAQRDAVSAHISERLGPEAAGFVTGETLDGLVDSYLGVLKGDPLGTAMFQLGKAVETFIKALAEIDPPIAIPDNVRTLGQVARFLKDHGRLKTKHHSLVVALTDIRNAADHSVDAEIGATWGFSRETALAANHLAWGLIRSFFAVEAGEFFL